MNFTTAERMCKKTVLMFLGYMKMGSEERKKSVFIIFVTYGSKTSFPWGKRGITHESRVFFLQYICIPSHLPLWWPLFISACSWGACLAGQHFWRGGSHRQGGLRQSSGHGVWDPAAAQHPEEPLCKTQLFLLQTLCNIFLIFFF